MSIYVKEGISADISNDIFYFNGQLAVKDSVKVKKIRQTGEGGRVTKGQYYEEHTADDGTVYVEGVYYSVNVDTSYTYILQGQGPITVPVASTVDVQFSWKPYVEPPPDPVIPSPGGDEDLPEVLLEDTPLVTEEEWNDYRIAWGGFNIPYVDEYHQETLGNFEIKAPEAFQSPHIKDSTIAEKIAKKIIFDSQLDLEVQIPGSPYFHAELGDFVQLTDSFNSIDSIEKLHSISWDETNQQVNFGFKAREL